MVIGTELHWGRSNEVRMMGSMEAERPMVSVRGMGKGSKSAGTMGPVVERYLLCTGNSLWHTNGTAKR